MPKTKSIQVRERIRRLYMRTSENRQNSEKQKEPVSEMDSERNILECIPKTSRSESEEDEDDEKKYQKGRRTKPEYVPIKTRIFKKSKTRYVKLESDTESEEVEIKGNHGRRDRQKGEERSRTVENLKKHFKNRKHAPRPNVVILDNAGKCEKASIKSIASSFGKLSFTECQAVEKNYCCLIPTCSSAQKTERRYYYSSESSSSEDSDKPKKDSDKGFKESSTLPLSSLSKVEPQEKVENKQGKIEQVSKESTNVNGSCSKSFSAQKEKMDQGSKGGSTLHPSSFKDNEKSINKKHRYSSDSSSTEKYQKQKEDSDRSTKETITQHPRQEKVEKKQEKMDQGSKGGSTLHPSSFKDNEKSIKKKHRYSSDSSSTEKFQKQKEDSDRSTKETITQHPRQEKVEKKQEKMDQGSKGGSTLHPSSFKEKESIQKKHLYSSESSSTEEFPKQKADLDRSSKNNNTQTPSLLSKVDPQEKVEDEHEKIDKGIKESSKLPPSHSKESKESTKKKYYDSAESSSAEEFQKRKADSDKSSKKDNTQTPSSLSKVEPQGRREDKQGKINQGTEKSSILPPCSLPRKGTQEKMKYKQEKVTQGKKVSNKTTQTWFDYTETKSSKRSGKTCVDAIWNAVTHSCFLQTDVGSVTLCADCKKQTGSKSKQTRTNPSKSQTAKKKK